VRSAGVRHVLLRTLRDRSPSFTARGRVVSRHTDQQILTTWTGHGASTKRRGRKLCALARSRCQHSTASSTPVLLRASIDPPITAPACLLFGRTCHPASSIDPQEWAPAELALLVCCSWNSSVRLQCTFARACSRPGAGLVVRDVRGPQLRPTYICIV
jgi:hypothetical protein